MTAASYEIRLCMNCGLRYPLTKGHPFGVRCPVCLGETRVVLSRKLVTEPNHTPSPSSKGRRESAVLLDNIRSAWNVGSILRSADGFGFSHAYLCGITPTPEQDKVQKTSLGAEESVTWSYHKDAVKLAKGLKKEGWRVWALEEDKRAVNIQGADTKRSNRENTVLIVGNEVTGVDPGLLNLADQIFCIPMCGSKRSFNVAVAFGIALAMLGRQASD